MVSLVKFEATVAHRKGVYFSMDLQITTTNSD